MAKQNSKYCPTHSIEMNEDTEKRIPCPIDPNQFVLLDVMELLILISS